MTQRIIGVIKWFNLTKGYGFIGMEGGDDVFMHISSFQGNEVRTLEKGQKVEFSVEESPKGLQASKVIPYKN